MPHDTPPANDGKVSRLVRNARAMCLFVFFLFITAIFDPVLAIETGAYCIVVMLIISHVRQGWKEPRPLWGKLLGMSVGLGVLFAPGWFFIMTAVMIGSLVAVNSSCSQGGRRLREVVIALHNYHQDMNRLPAPASYSPTGQPLLSWRVHLLPYLGQEKLYRQFQLNKPWDSPHNQALLAHMPECYRLPAYGQQSPGGGTFIQLIVGKGAVFEKEPTVTLPELQACNSLDCTIIAGIAQEAVPWTKPADLVFEDGKPLALGRVVRQSPTPITSLLLGRGIHHEPVEGNRSFRIVFADGSCRSVVSREALWKVGPLIRWKGPKPKEFDLLD